MGEYKFYTLFYLLLIILRLFYRRLIPGDRLLFVNDINLENASLDQAVQALKSAAKGVVRIGVCKPLPMADSSFSLSFEQSGSANMFHGPKPDIIGE